MKDEQGVSRRDFLTRGATAGGALALLLGGAATLRGGSRADAQTPPPEPEPVDPPTPPDPPEEPEPIPGESCETESVCAPIPESAESEAEPEPLPGSTKPGKKKSDDKGPSCG